MTRSELLAIIEDIRRHVEAGDSWEGYLNWLIPDPDDNLPPDIVAVVEARYRIGNSDGSQGGMLVLGGIQQD